MPQSCLSRFTGFPPPPSLRVSVHSHREANFPVSGCRLPPSAPVPSSWFFPTATACSTHAFVGLLHPTSGPEVRRVSGFLRPLVRDTPESVVLDAGWLSPFPLRLHPSKNPPHPQPFCVTAAVAFLPLPLGEPLSWERSSRGPPTRRSRTRGPGTSCFGDAPDASRSELRSTIPHVAVRVSSNPEGRRVHAGERSLTSDESLARARRDAAATIEPASRIR
jgi:hypothetical protein